MFLRSLARKFYAGKIVNGNLLSSMPMLVGFKMIGMCYIVVFPATDHKIHKIWMVLA